MMANDGKSDALVSFTRLSPGLRDRSLFVRSRDFVASPDSLVLLWRTDYVHYRLVELLHRNFTSDFDRI